MVELCLTCGQGEVQKFLIKAWDKNALQVNFKTKYILTGLLANEGFDKPRFQLNTLPKQK